MVPPNNRPGWDVAGRIQELAAFSDAPNDLTRLHLGPAHRQAMDVLVALMQAAGMQSRLDAMGVITAIEVLRGMAMWQRRHPFAVEVIAFGDEEGGRFPTTLSGSCAVAGIFDPACLSKVDKHGISRRDGLVAFGCDVPQIAREARSPAPTLGYVEVRIEQGPVLEIKGTDGHAGGVPMRLRRDALIAPAEMLMAVESRARQDGELVATIGQLEVPDGTRNTIPGLVRFTLDIRDSSDKRRRQAVSEITDHVRLIAQARQVEAAVSLSHDAPAALCDRRLSDLLAASIERGCQMTAVRLPSGARS
jgi:allantoate deiminase